VKEVIFHEKSEIKSEKSEISEKSEKSEFVEALFNPEPQNFYQHLI
jgi:hypothetical protein